MHSQNFKSRFYSDDRYCVTRVSSC